MGTTVGFIPMPSLLADSLPSLDQCHLSTRLIVNGSTKRAHRIQILDLTACTEFCARASHADIGIHPHRPFLHLCVRGTDGHENRSQFGDILTGLLGGADVGTTNDFHQRNAGAVEVDQRGIAAMDAAATSALMGGLARVLFEVGALHTNPSPIGEIQPTVHIERNVVLADLIGLWHIGIEVVLAMKGAGLHRAIQRQADPHSELHCLAIQHRQRAGQPEGHRINIGVGFVSEAVGATRKQLGGGGKFHMDLKANNHFVTVDHELAHHFTPFEAAATAADSRAAATRNITGSAKVAAIICTPTGRSFAPVPKGTLIAG